MSKPNVLVLRGNSVNPWDLRPLERLQDEFDFRVLVPRENDFATNELAIPHVAIRTRAGFAPPGRVRATGQIAPINRMLGAKEHFEWADIVHSAELATWFTAQAAAAKQRCGFKLLSTVWETIPFGNTYRNRFSAANRDLAIEQVDLFLPTTERARAALLTEGVSDGHMVLAPPGIDPEAFTPGAAAQAADDDPVIISPGRLVWEKGHQDVIRALAALRDGTVPIPAGKPEPRLLIVGKGPEEQGLRAYAAELGLGEQVELRGGVGYAQMAEEYRRASAMVLASLPVPRWEEQFGMVLVEAMASGLPVIASSSGAIPEVVGDAGRLFAPGDWLGLARILADIDYRAERERFAVAREERVALYSVAAAAERYADAYQRVVD